MSDTVIRVGNLGKRYRIGGKQERYNTFRETITGTLRSRISRLAIPRSSNRETFWALRDISFEVKQGEVLGLIGRNGAGKSTLLKILSQITEPTEGIIYLKGRVGALLEVGTGFHPELTGRENVYLNGAILGMKRHEIDRKFDEIVDFAGVEKFIDTPVKRYSSGMGLRLGFAVAAYLEPEILIVDEVLAVGDAEFQRKCLGKMNNIAGEGRTVLFVSHNMAAVEQLCSRAILLNFGHTELEGSVKTVVEHYVNQAMADNQDDKRLNYPISNGSGTVGITNISTSIEFLADEPCLRITVGVIANERIAGLGVGFSLTTTRGIVVSSQGPALTNYIIPNALGEYSCHILCKNISQYLAEGEYFVNVWLTYSRLEILLRIDQVALITTPSVDPYRNGITFEINRHGIVPLPATFSYEGNSP